MERNRGFRGKDRGYRKGIGVIAIYYEALNFLPGLNIRLGCPLFAATSVAESRVMGLDDFEGRRSERTCRDSEADCS